MTTATVTDKIDDLQRWSGWTKGVLERLPLPYPLTCTLVGLLTVAEQVLEHSLNDPTFSNVTSTTVATGLVFPILILTVYMLIFLKILKRGAVKALAELRPTVLISDEEYDDHVRRMVSPDRRVVAALLIISVAIVLISSSDLPPSLPIAAFISASYVLGGWLLLTLFYASIRHARILRALARRPLAINVFDPTNLLPFGRLGLLHSLPNVGVMVIPLILLGPPAQVGYLVILLSLGSVLALFIPLWGVHQQIDQAKERVLASICEQLVDIQSALCHGTEAEMENLANLADRTATLVHFRKLIQESPSWPFKDTAAVARAVVAALSPLIYFIFTEIIRAYLFPIPGG